MTTEFDNRGEEPLDAANQSLADALRASFRILKFIMAFLLILYLLSGINFIQPDQQAVVFRLGKLKKVVYTPGPMAAWPLPIDEVVRLKTKQSNEVTIDTQMLALTDEEKKKGLNFVSRGNSGLDPVRDGALLTGDKGLVHIQWVVTYKIEDLAAYVRNLRASTLKEHGLDAANAIVQIQVENAAIEIAAGWKTDDVYRRQLDRLRLEVMKRANQRLASLETGISIKQVKAPISIVPIQVRGAFTETQEAENEKSKMVQEARKDRTNVLNDTAGAAFEKVLDTMDKRDLALANGDDASLALHNEELDRLFDEEVSGEAGKLLKQASAYYAQTVGRIQNDVKIYKTLLPDYKDNAKLLFSRLWDETRDEILNNRKVTKIYRPFNIQQVRIRIGPDPDQKRSEEIRRLEEDVKDRPAPRPIKMLPVGPE